MLNLAICDDEPYMVQELSAHLAAYMGGHTTYQLSSFTDGPALLESSRRFDIIFLDIQMEPVNGMEIARRLRQKGERGILIFVTVLKDCVFDSFEVEAHDYLVKPLDAGRFRRTMDRALKTLTQQNGGSLLIQKGSSCERIPFSEIVYCEVQGRKIYIHQCGGAVTDYYDHLEDLEQRLDSRFFKCHRSYLVNLDHVRGRSGGRVMLSQGEQIPLSRLRERDFMQALLRRMKEC